MSRSLFLLCSRAECRPPGPGTFLKLKPFDLKHFFSLFNVCKALSPSTSTRETFQDKAEIQQHSASVVEPGFAHCEEDGDEEQVESMHDVPLVQELSIIQSAHEGGDEEVASTENDGSPVEPDFLTKGLYPQAASIAQLVASDGNKATAMAENEGDEEKAKCIDGGRPSQNLSTVGAAVDVEKAEETVIEQENEEDFEAITECLQSPTGSIDQPADGDASKGGAIAKNHNNGKNHVDLPQVSNIAQEAVDGDKNNTEGAEECVYWQKPLHSQPVVDVEDEEDMISADDDEDEINFITESPPPQVSVMQPVSEETVAQAPIMRKRAQPVSWRARLLKSQAKQCASQQSDKSAIDPTTTKEESIGLFNSRDLQFTSPPPSYPAGYVSGSEASTKFETFSPKSDEPFTFSANTAPSSPTSLELSTENSYGLKGSSASETKSVDKIEKLQAEEAAMEANTRLYLSTQAVEDVVAWIERSDCNPPNLPSSPSSGPTDKASASPLVVGSARKLRKKANRKARQASKVSAAKLEQELEAGRLRKEEAKQEHQRLKKMRQKMEDGARKGDADNNNIGGTCAGKKQNKKMHKKTKAGKETRRAGYLFG